MARTFDGTNDQMYRTSATVPAAPLTLAAWFYYTGPEDDYASHFILSTGRTVDQYEYHTLGMSASSPDNILYAASEYRGTSGSSQTSPFSNDVWYHGAGVFASATSRIVYLNGIAGTEDTTSVTEPANEEVRIGRKPRAAVLWWDGRLAECAVWDVVLTAGEIKCLAAGVSPQHVRPQSLAGYWPLFSNKPTLDYASTKETLTDDGTTAGDHAPVRPMFGFDFSGSIWAPSAGGVAATAGVVALDFTALDATVIAEAKATAEIVALDYIALDATVIAEARATAEVVSFEVSALDATVTVGVSVSIDDIPALDFTALDATVIAEAKATAEIVALDYIALDATVISEAKATAEVVSFEFSALDATATVGVSVSVDDIPGLDFSALNATVSVPGVSATAGVVALDYTALDATVALVEISATAGVATYEYVTLDAQAFLGIVGVANLVQVDMSALDCTASSLGFKAGVEETWTIPAGGSKWTVPAGGDTWTIP
jgi:hypothetical protein